MRAAVESGLADRVIAALDKLVADLHRSDRLDLCLAYARGIPWISEVLLGAETADQVLCHLLVDCSCRLRLDSRHQLGSRFAAGVRQRARQYVIRAICLQHMLHDV